MVHLLLTYGRAAMWFAICVNGLYVCVFLLAAINVGGHARQGKYPAVKLPDAHALVPISILIPAYNEAVTAETTIRNLLSLNYPRYEIIIVNDGSTDDTMTVLRNAFELEPQPGRVMQSAVPVSVAPTGVYMSRTHANLTVIDKPNTGKGDTLNTAINFASAPLLTAIDADTLLDPDALQHLAQAYIQDPSRIVAMGGHVRVGNGCRIVGARVVETGVPRSLLARCQLVEYTKAFVGGRTGWAAANGLLIVSGAFGVFRRDILEQIGGYTNRRPGEDMEVILHIHKHMCERRIPYRVVFCPQAVCWTQAPEKLRILASQRRRWGKGNVHNMRRYRYMLMNPRYGFVGMLSVPYTVFVEMLNPYILISGVAVLMAMMFLFHPGFHEMLWLLAFTLGLDYMLGFGALMLDDIAFHTYGWRDMIKIGFTALHMPLWYYYLSNYWRIGGHVEYFTDNQGWGDMTRQSWTATEPKGSSDDDA